MRRQRCCFQNKSMRLAKIQLARSIWLFDTGEMNPQGVSLFPALVSKIAERYHFRQFPKSEAIPIGSSTRFEYGEFVNDGQTYEVALEIFADGITADSRHSTGVSDLFILDLLKWACQEFGLSYSPGMGKKRVYRSEIVVYADQGLVGLCEKFDRMSAAVNEITGNPAELTAVHFGRDEKLLSVLSFERKANEPLEDLKFYSAAIMETPTHIKLLDLLGSILFGGPSSIDAPNAPPPPSEIAG
jgi:hypothetical protein